MKIIVLSVVTLLLGDDYFLLSSYEILGRNLPECPVNCAGHFFMFAANVRGFSRMKQPATDKSRSMQNGPEPKG